MYTMMTSQLKHTMRLENQLNQQMVDIIYASLNKSDLFSS